MIDAPIHTSESNLIRVLGAGLPVALVFWRRDCPPCDQLTPALDHLARGYAGRALIVKVNAEEERVLLGRYNVSRLPSIVFVKEGSAVATATGAISEQDLTAWMDYLTRGGVQPALASGPSIPIQATPAGAGQRPAQERATQERAASAGRGGQATGAGQPTVLTDATFDQVVRASSVPVMVDFWAVWCGPCKMVAPTVEQMAGEFAGRALMAKLNVDDNPAIASRYGIMSIPTLLIFRNGQIVDRIVGAQPVQVLRQRLSQQLRS